MKNKRVCPSCEGAGVFESCRRGHTGNCPCSVAELICDECRGERVVPYKCANCSEDPVELSGDWCRPCVDTLEPHARARAAYDYFRRHELDLIFVGGASGPLAEKFNCSQTDIEDIAIAELLNTVQASGLDLGFGVLA